MLGCLFLSTELQHLFFYLTDLDILYCVYSILARDMSVTSPINKCLIAIYSLTKSHGPQRSTWSVEVLEVKNLLKTYNHIFSQASYEMNWYSTPVQRLGDEVDCPVVVSALTI